MADVTVVAASVAKGSDSSTDDGIAGETITAGQVVYLKTSDGRYWKADANDTSATAAVSGIALHGSLAGQPLRIQTAGQITLGTTPLTIGGFYILSVNPGGIAPFADAAPASYMSGLGFAVTAAILKLRVDNTGIQHA